MRATGVTGVTVVCPRCRMCVPPSGSDASYGAGGGWSGRPGGEHTDNRADEKAEVQFKGKSEIVVAKAEGWSELPGQKSSQQLSRQKAGLVFRGRRVVRNQAGPRSQNRSQRESQANWFRVCALQTI